MRLLLLAILVVFAVEAHAYQLLVVQTVSASKKSFVTRNGKRQGVVEGLTGTFIADDVAIHARARTVTSQFTQWEIVSSEAVAPFTPGQIVTYHPAQEYLWALNPEEARQKAMLKVRAKTRGSMLIKAATTRGLNETVSGADPQNSTRGGLALDGLYESMFHPNLAWDAGLRYEREIANMPQNSLTTQRLMLVADFLFYSDVIEAFHSARVFVGGGAGWGQSSTEVAGATQSGKALLLPSAKLGVTLPFNHEWDFVAESAFETLKTDEKLEDGTRQTTNQSNLRIGLGLRKFF